MLGAMQHKLGVTKSFPLSFPKNVLTKIVMAGQLIMRNYMKKLSCVWSDSKGQTSVEYVVGLLFFGVVIAFILQAFFGALSGLFDQLSDCLAKPYP